MGAYQIWHRDGETFRKVAEVQADDVTDAVQFTQNDECVDDPHEGELWIDQAGVILAIEVNPRSTTFGDIILTPDGDEFIIVDAENEYGFDLQPTDAIRHQEYAEWLGKQPGLFAEPQPTLEEQTALFQEWRDHAASQAMAEKGVDYSDAPYAEPTESTYADALKQGIARAKHQTRGLDAPEL